LTLKEDREPPYIVFISSNTMLDELAACEDGRKRRATTAVASLRRAGIAGGYKWSTAGGYDGAEEEGEYEGEGQQRPPFFPSPCFLTRNGSTA
jgi:hypothetical protein